MLSFRALLAAVALAFALASCGGGDGSTAPRGDGWTEEEVTFSVGPNQLHGILTLPASEGRHSAVLIASGSESQSGSTQSGVSGRYFTDLAYRLAGAGSAAFRYDTRGVGESQGGAGVQTLEAKRDEVLAALHCVQEHPAIRPDHVGLWGMSQEAWTISLAAPSGPMRWPSSSRSRAPASQLPNSRSGGSRLKVALPVSRRLMWGGRATPFGRLLVDWQLTEPLFRDANQELSAELGDGPWQDFLALAQPATPVRRPFTRVLACEARLPEIRCP